MNEFAGRCFCGAVEIKVKGMPEAMGYCHCSSCRSCQNCGGHVMTAHPGWKIIDVYAAMIPDLAFAPALHVNYAEKVLAVVDGLPKFKDFPSELGGSGERLAE
jgi:hypothetical protein